MTQCSSLRTETPALDGIACSRTISPHSTPISRSSQLAVDRHARSEYGRVRASLDAPSESASSRRHCSGCSSSTPIPRSTQWLQRRACSCACRSCCTATQNTTHPPGPRPGAISSLNPEQREHIHGKDLCPATTALTGPLQVFLPVWPRRRVRRAAPQARPSPATHPS